MKTNFKFFTVAIAAIMTIGTVTLVSCDKNENETIVGHEQYSATKGVFNPANPANPYDYMGVDHNYYIDKCMPDVYSYIMNYGGIDVSQAITISNQILAQNGFDTNGIRTIAMKIETSADSNFMPFIMSSFPNQKIRNCISKLVSDILQMAQDENYDYEDIHKFILARETKYATSGEYSNEELGYIYPVTSVMRHSMYYWYNNGFGPVNPKKASVWKWLGRIAVVATCDALGSVGGTATAVAASVGSYQMAKDMFPDDKPNQPTDTTSNGNNNGGN